MTAPTATIDLSALASAIAQQVQAEQVKPVLNANEAAALLGVTRNTFTRYCREIPGFPARRVGGYWYVNRESLLRWLDGAA